MLKILGAYYNTKPYDYFDIYAPYAYTTFRGYVCFENGLLIIKE